MSTTDSEPPVADPRVPDIGDPVIDLATGRNLVTIQRSADSVEEWNENHSYDLLSNTGNQALGTSPMDPVFTCVYVNDVSSKPSKTYDFPVSRLGRPLYENATEDGLRVRDIITRDVLTALYAAADEDHVREHLTRLCGRAFIQPELVDEAREIAHAATITATDEEVDA